MGDGKSCFVKIRGRNREYQRFGLKGRRGEGVGKWRNEDRKVLRREGGNKRFVIRKELVTRGNSASERCGGGISEGEEGVGDEDVIDHRGLLVELMGKVGKVFSRGGINGE